jgi:hypothetical protein
MVTVGALGDSYTDEYRFYPPDRSLARNWVEILAATKRVSFGPFTTTSRGEPRDQGFAFNWARSDATSVDMVANQLPGLTAQVASGQVAYAWIFVGGNDFLYFLRGVHDGSIPASSAQATLDQVEARAEANLGQAVDGVLAASPTVRVVVGTLPDVAALPIVQQAAAPQEQAIVAATSQAIRKYNAAIQRRAGGDPRIAVVDLALSTAELGLVSGPVPYGGTAIDVRTPGDDYHHFFLADRIHIGTVAQGIIADSFVSAVDGRFGAHIAPLSPRQIVAFARRAQAGSRHGGGPP